MNKIKILSPQEAQKVAAGEVVERPANIVKELIENSLDARSSQVSLYIEKAGKKLIHVVDNGSGMSHDDAKACFLSHATSKLSKIEDLEHIKSFGFRGEALASISSVSKVTLITRLCSKENKNEDLGIKLHYVAGRVEKEESIACKVGTDILIADLFYNIPVRKKFLKQDETEWNQILFLFQAFCLSHKAVHFKLFRDGKLVLNAPSVSIVKDRISQLWGYNLSENIISLSNESEDTHIVKQNWLNISGLISTHNFWRYGRNQIFFFVNNRWVKSQELNKAIFKGYLNVLPPGRFPAAFIFITVDVSQVDINVHPKKEEVRFIKPMTVQTVLQRVIKQTLEDHLTRQIAPHQENENMFGFSDGLSEEITSDVQKNNCEVSVKSVPRKSYDEELFNEELFIEDVKKEVGPTEQYSNLSIDIHDKQHSNKVVQDVSYNVIGQLFDTYILLEKDDQFTLIDQHAAHERILYEKLLRNFEKKDGTVLLFPEVIRLPEKELNLLLLEKEFFSRQGIELELFGKQEVVIKTSPPNIHQQSLKELILEAVAFIQEHASLEEEVFRKKLNEHVHSHMACKAAVKAGDKLTDQQMKQLISDLNKTEKRFICIHGRPTTWSISKSEIEKRFRRR